MYVQLYDVILFVAYTTQTTFREVIYFNSVEFPLDYPTVE